MAQLETLLDEMRLCIRKADFKGMSALAPALEAALTDGAVAVNALTLQRVKTKADENAALLDAARRGIRAARRRVEDARRATIGLQTYDGKGRRADITPAGPTAGRF